MIVVTSPLTYNSAVFIITVARVMNQAPEACNIKLFMAVIY
jgi:hypothetical protein